ncbi:MAG TPA: SDR family oxidoreductase [Myxococcaceae bacterium]|nr:SDR family oxidoreductase [Myxococcaceae bacterium]
MELRGKAVIVTGASRGLGAALAEELGRVGARLVLVSRDVEALGPVVQRIRAHGGEAHALVADVSAPDAASRIAGTSSALVGPVDVVIHNAGTLGPVPLAPLADTSDADFEQALATNLLGPFRLTRALVGSMALRGRGTVVLVSSDAASTPYAGWGAYGVSKAALEHLGRIWDTELSAAGVRFLTVDPGEMDTRMHREAVPEADPSTLLRPEQGAARVLAKLREAA